MKSKYYWTGNILPHLDKSEVAALLFFQHRVSVKTLCQILGMQSVHIEEIIRAHYSYERDCRQNPKHAAEILTENEILLDF